MQIFSCTCHGARLAETRGRFKQIGLERFDLFPFPDDAQRGAAYRWNNKRQDGKTPSQKLTRNEERAADARRFISVWFYGVNCVGKLKPWRHGYITTVLYYFSNGKTHNVQHIYYIHVCTADTPLTKTNVMFVFLRGKPRAIY